MRCNFGVSMRFAQGAYNFQRKRYAAVLTRCRRIAMLLVGGAFAALPATAANLSINAQNGHATLDAGGVYEQINVTGAPDPVLDITKRLTIVGPGSNAPIITSASSAHLRVIDTTLNFGSATRTNGGMLRGSAFLDKGTIQVYSNNNSTAPASFYLGGGDSSGAIHGDGSLLLKQSALASVGQVGQENEPLPSIQLDYQSHLQIRDGLFADSVIINEASIAVTRGDINIEDLNLNGAGSSIQADQGDIFINNLVSTSPDDELFAQTGINADEGSITIAGDMNLARGLTAIRAGHDITIARGEGSIKGPGELYLRANGHVNAGNVMMENSDLEALRMNVGGNLTARNALAAQLSANKVNIGENLEIQGNSVQIFGVKVDYGLLEIKGEGSRVGGDARVFDAVIDVPDLSIGKNAIFSAVRGNFASLDIADELDFAAGDLAGDSVSARSIVMGESEFATTLNVKNIGFQSLKIGSLGALATDAMRAP